MSKKKKKNKKRFYSELENKAFFLYTQMGEGKTLEEVAAIRNVPYSDLVDEINEEPTLIQAMKDGKAKGHAFWIKKLKEYMIDKNTNPTAIRIFYGNYMDWWTSPLPIESSENTTVIINVTERKITKKENEIIERAKK